MGPSDPARDAGLYGAACLGDLTFGVFLHQEQFSEFSIPLPYPGRCPVTEFCHRLYLLGGFSTRHTQNPGKKSVQGSPRTGPVGRQCPRHSYTCGILYALSTDACFCRSNLYPDLSVHPPPVRSGKRLLGGQDRKERRFPETTGGNLRILDNHDTLFP